MDSEVSNVVAIALGEEVGEGEELGLVAGYLFGNVDSFGKDGGLIVAEGVAD